MNIENKKINIDRKQDNRHDCNQDNQISFHVYNFEFNIIIKVQQQIIMKNSKAAAQALKSCNKVLIGAGAGIGKDSGLPDFRGNQGFWNNYPPYRNKFDFYYCASPEFLQRQPHLFWGFYGSRLLMYRQKSPHYGFNILKQISSHMNDHYIITSNVDGHFHKNFEPNQILQVHGSIHKLQCYFCDYIYNNQFQPIINHEEMSCKNLPHCPKCSSVTRPNILMFGDWQWLSFETDRQRQYYSKFTKGIKKDDKIGIIEIGCGQAIPTIRNMCQRIYYEKKNSILIRINTDQDCQSEFKDPRRFFYLQSSALAALKQLGKLSYNIQ